MRLENSTESRENMWRIDEWFPHLSDDARRLLADYHRELITFNRAINLISGRSEKIADLVHFADCILGSEIVLKGCEGPEIYDLGSGNGLPGVILGILSPQLRVHLIESDSRKVEFLKHLVNRLGLGNVVPHHMRVEELEAESIQFAVSRGFASIQKALLVSRKSFSKNGQYFHFKGDAWVREVAEIPSQMCRFWIPMLVDDYSLPVGNSRLSIVVTKKIG